MKGKGKYTVALCDILGFSNLVKQNPLDQVVDSSLDWFRCALYHSIYKSNFPEVAPSLEELQQDANIGVAWFSDTILLYTLEDTDDCVRNLLQTVGWLLFETLSDGETPVRGGIAYGEAFIDPDNSIFVGQAIIEAYEIEKSQSWIGIALSDTAVERVPKAARSGVYADWWIKPYEVPLKGGKSKHTLVIDWTLGGHFPSDLKWPEESTELRETDQEKHQEVCDKWNNTLEFHQNVCHCCNTSVAK